MVLPLLDFVRRGGCPSCPSRSDAYVSRAGDAFLKVAGARLVLVSS